MMTSTQKAQGPTLRVRLTLVALVLAAVLLAAYTGVVSLLGNAGTTQAVQSPGNTQVFSASDEEGASEGAYAASNDGMIGEYDMAGPQAAQESTVDGELLEIDAETVVTLPTKLLVMAALLLLGAPVAYLAMGWALKPLHALSREINGISEHALSKRLPENERDAELGTLAVAFNRLLSHLEKVFATQRGFASAAAHELKTPLAAIKANVDVLEMDRQPSHAEYENLAVVTKTQTNRMIHLVEDLFTISMGETYDFTDQVDLPALLQSIVDDMQHAIDEKQLQVTLHGQCRHPMVGNLVMLRHSLSNIVDNAVKYNADAGSISITALETDRSYVVTVADTGMGIPQEHRQHVFEPFYRVDKSRSRRMGGAGLGLSIAHDMIDRHGGRISVWENDPQGTVFTVELPKAFRE